MIDNIISIFKEQAREHKLIKAFYYNRSYEKGSGKDRYPLFWLEDPLTGRNENNLFTNSANFCVLFVPQDNVNTEYYQNLAFSIGLNIIERIKKSGNANGISILPNWSYTTLRHYYDDDAAGCRFTVSFNLLNMQNLCLIDEQFDKNKAFEDESFMPSINLNPKNGCEIFVNKLPDFDLKTKK